MIVTSKITMDLLTPGVSPIVNAVQNDLHSREIAITLLAGRQPWKIPAGANARIYFRKSDGRGGIYDTLPDGTPAWHADGNVLRFALAPQVLTTPGSVHLTVRLLEEDRELGSFAIWLQVSPVANAVAPDSGESGKADGTETHPWNLLPHGHLSICSSDIRRKPANTAEHFADAAENFGYNALSCEVRLTSDGELVCCADPGFTLDPDGIITAFQDADFTAVRDMTAEECMALSHATGEHPCLIGAFLDICRKHEMIAFVTISGEYPEEAISALLARLKRHNMVHSAIVSSADYGCLAQWRRKDGEVMLNYMLPFGVAMDAGQIEKAAALGCCSLCGFSLNRTTAEPDDRCDFAFAAEKGIRLLQSVAYHRGSPEVCYAMGYDGCLIGVPWAPATKGTWDVRSYGVFPGEDCTAALQDAVRECRRLYFPAGVYRFSGVTITEDTDFVLAPDAVFHSDSAEFMINAYDCSFCMHGGRLSSGTEYPDRHKTPYSDDSRKMTGGNNGGIIALYGCHHCVMENIAVPYSSHGSVFTVIGDRKGKNTESQKVTANDREITIGRSREIRFLNCMFNNFLLSAIHVLYGNDNILVDGCSFTHALRAKGVDYGYCVCTGVKDVVSEAALYYTPTNGYVIRNCYVNNCEGTALDSHGASNVIYEGNTLVDCDSFITAYWDYARVKTADGWRMENITVRGNFCRTTKAFDYAANTFGHNPFMLHSNGPLGRMRNLIVENNMVDTNFYLPDKNGNPWEMAAVSFVDNIVFRNNVFKSTAATACLTKLTCCRNVEFDNTTLVGTFCQGICFYTAMCRLGKFDCSEAAFTAAMFAAEEKFFSAVDTDNLMVLNPPDNMFANWSSTLNRYAKPLQAADSILPMNGSVSTHKGFVGKNLSVQATIISRTSNTVTTGSYRFLPGTRVIVGEGAYYVVKVESNADRTRYTYTLDKNLGASGQTAAYISLSIPYTSSYTTAAAE